MTTFIPALLRLKSALLLLLFALAAFVAKAQYATEIFTDYNGFWRSSVTTFSTTLPNKGHDLIGFTYGGVTYSTDVNNSILTNRGVPFTAGHYKTLPFTSLNGTTPSNSNSIYVCLGEQHDNVANGYSSPFPTIKAKEALTDGVNGLNIGTGVTDLPSSAGMTFPAQIISTSAILDNQPDMIYAQMTDAANSADVLLFQDSQGHTVGKSNSIQWNLIKPVANYSADYYKLRSGAALDTASITSGVTANTTQSLRLVTIHLSDFGITAANASQVTTLVIKPAGSSDPAFIAYNSDAIYIIPPIINTQPQTQVVCTGTGQSATFSVDATGLSLSYQWLKNGVNIAGATGASYTIPSVTASDLGYYQVVVTNPGGIQYSDLAYLNIVINRQPSPASQTIVTGNTVVYSVSATNATSYQWKKNGVNIPGATDSVYTISPVTTADNGSYTVSVINPSSGGCASLTSNAVSLTPAIVVYSKSTPDINIPSTWGANTDGSGSTPVDFTRSEHTFVLSNRPYGNTLTDLTIAGTLDVSNGVAIISDNTTLDVGWCIRSGTGSLTGSSTSSFTVRGNSNLYFTPGSQILKNFTVTGGTVNMLSDLVISGGSVLPGKLNLTGGTLALGNNKITIRSTSLTNTSMVTAMGASAAVTYGTSGAFVVERFFPGRRAYRFVSAAVTTKTSIKNNWMEGAVNPDRWTNYDPIPGYGTHISGPKFPTDSLDVTQTYNPSLFTFDNNAQSWNAVQNSSSVLTVGNAYRIIVRGSRAVDLNNNDATPSNTIIRSTGTIKTGTYTVGASGLSTKVGGYSFVGNPYACPVNWLTLGRSGVASSYYTWDENLSRRGTYVAYNGISQTSDKPASMVDENIQSGQGFFIQSTSVTPSLTFNESNKSYTNTSVFRGANTMTKLTVQLLLNLDGGSNNTADGCVAVFGDDFMSSIGEDDAYKFTNLDENIAIDHNGIPLAIEGRPFVVSNDTIAIKMWQFRQKDYWLKIDGQNFAPGLTATLKDRFLKRDVPLNLASSTVVPFLITSDSASFDDERFSIVFAPIVTSVLPVMLTQIKASAKDKGIQVEWKTATETGVASYVVEKSLNGVEFETVGMVRAKGNNAGNDYSWLDNNAGSGNNFYRIKIVENTGSSKYSEVVKVNISDTKSDISVLPNPTNGTTISLQFLNMIKGAYSINLFNTIGQTIYTNTLNHIGGSAAEIITLPNRMSPGRYTLHVSSDKFQTTKTVIVQ